MGLFTSFNRRDNQIDFNADSQRLVVDLALFTIGQTPLGKPPWEGDFFAEALTKLEVFEVAAAGYELTLENGGLASVTLTLDKFPGALLLNGEEVPLSTQTTPGDIRALLGKPYWTDRDDDEIILFYEYEKGCIELQCEFPDGRHLGYLTLMQNGILSHAGQRESYGVTREWPPADPS